MSLTYIDKSTRQCKVCKDTKNSHYYYWYTFMSNETLICCNKCALREYGKSYVTLIREGRKDDTKRPI